MEWSDRGIVLSARRHGESSAVVSALTAAHGRHAGLVRGAKRAGGTFEPGNLVQLRWRARLEDHLGNFQAELIHSFAASLLDDPLKLAALTSACALIDSALAERERHDKVFESLSGLLNTLEQGTSADWQGVYVRFEFNLLTDLGFGLDLSQCAATGRNDTLVFVSPKTGRAVSATAGEPYRDRLLPLPGFLLDTKATASSKEIADGLLLTGSFLERHVFAPHGKKFPLARTRLIDRIVSSDNVAPGKEA